MLKNPLANITKSQVSLSFKIAAVTIATIALFSQDLTMLFSDALQSETTSHLLAIPFLFAYLIYRKRKILRAVTPIKNTNEPKETRHLPLISGVLLAITAILLYWYGSYTFTPIEYHMLALPIFTAGLTLIIFNPQTLRQLAFPIAFLIFLMPPPSEILYAFGSTLSVISAEASNSIVNFFGIPSTITSEYGNPTIIITRPDNTLINFTVDIACSGIYSLIGFLIFAVFIAYIIRDKLWKKLALITIGIPLIYLLNIIRITIILTLGYNFGEELSLQTFHLLGGWILIFLGTLLLLAISEKILKTQFFTNKPEKCSQCSSKEKHTEESCSLCGRILKPLPISIDKIDILKITAIMASIIILISIQAPVFALTQASPTVIVNTPSGQQISTQILPQIPNYNLHFLERDTDFEKKAKQDMSLIYLYTPTNASLEPIWVTIEIAPTRSSLHRWETCLITWPISKGYQPKVTQIELKDIQLNENPPIIGRYFAFTYIKTNETQVVLYWYETTTFTFTINSTSQQKNAKISVIAYPENTEEELQDTEKQLTAIAKNITSYWQPIKTWSQITMIISQNGANLATINMVILAVIFLIYILETKKQNKNNTNAYLKLSQNNKQTADAVKETEKRSTPTLDNIVVTYSKQTRKKITRDQMLQKLAELEKIGIIERTIINKLDEPILIWKSKIAR